MNKAKKIIHRIGVSENLILKLVTRFLSWPVRVGQFQLLKINKDKEAVDLVQRIQRDGNSLMWPAEMIQLYFSVFATKKLPGDLAEVGVYAGRSARLIREVSPNKALHLFDTFEGLPKPTSMDNSTWHEHMLAIDLASVKKYLANYQNINFYLGTFPETAKPIEDRTFSFVHFDVDLHQSTLECLKFFYPRMVKRGIMISHDYSNLAGVKKAFDEFFKDKDESVIELSTSQCIVIKS